MIPKASIITKHEDFLLYIIPILNKFPRDYKMLIADKIQNNLLRVLDLLIIAYYTNRSEKKSILAEINIEIEKIRHLFRLCHGLQIYNLKKYETISLKLNEIGKMNGAWFNSLK